MKLNHIMLNHVNLNSINTNRALGSNNKHQGAKPPIAVYLSLDIGKLNINKLK